MATLSSSKESGLANSEQDLPSSDSFWDVGNWRRVVERMENGARLCDDLNRMLNERAEIEAKYAKSLRSWRKKWEDLVEKGPQYGSTEKAWQAHLAEAEGIADLHAERSSRLVSECCAGVASYKRDHFHKSVLHFKECKAAEDGFERAQKPWAKRLAKVKSSKKSYHAACKAAETLLRQVADAERDPNISTEHCKKLKAKSEKAEKERNRTREKYADRVRDITVYNETYVCDMRTEFDKCQEFERDQLDFFRKTLLTCHDLLNAPASQPYVKVYEDFSATTQAANSAEDLQYYSRTFGADMGMQWPVFEEFSETDDLSRNQVSTRRYDGSKVRPTESVISAPVGVVDGGGAGDFSIDAEFDNVEPPKVDSDAIGLPVRALYDYTAVDSDELTFVAGDILTKLEEEDDQGWCRGRLNGQEGLFPANYCEPVQ